MTMVNDNQQSEAHPAVAEVAAAIGQLDLRDDSAVLQFGNDTCQKIEQLHKRKASLRKELAAVDSEIDARESGMRKVIADTKVSQEATAYLRKRLGRTMPKPPSKAARG